jgi:hypothetical protein
MKVVGCSEGAAAASTTEGDGNLRAIAAATREAVDLLAKEWLAEYQTRAVEWLTTDEVGIGPGATAEG